MRFQILATLLALPSLFAAAPPRKAPMLKATFEATVVFGPGHEPPPGTPPFRPRFEGILRFATPPPKGLKVRLWLVPVEAVKGMARPSAAKGAKPLAHESVPVDDARSLRAEWPQASSEDAWQAAVEFRVNGLYRGHVVTKVNAHFLPAAPPRGDRPGQEN